MMATVCTSRRWSSGRPCTDDDARAVPTISSIIRSANGRIASMRAWARRSRADATSSIAFVILRVFVTDLIRRRRSWTVAIGYAAASVSDGAKRATIFSTSARSFSWSSSDSSFLSAISA